MIFQKGFTLLEFIFALGIIVSLAVIGLVSFSSFRGKSDLNVATEMGVSLLNEARSQTVSALDASRYGVHFEANKITLFKGVQYTVGDALNKEYILPQGVEVSAVNLFGGGTDVIFNRLTGATNQYGTTTLRLISATTTFRFLVVSSSGVVNAQ